MKQPLSVHAWLRWDVIARLLPGDTASVLEIGAGLGSVGAMLARRFDYVGLEPDVESWREAQRRTGGRVLCETVENHASQYSLVCAFEVLEHIEDDVAALELWRERSSRWLLLSVPMNPARFSATDRFAGHFRRYTRSQLYDVLGAAGWSPLRLCSYGFPIGYALEAGRSAIFKRRAKGETLEDRTRASGRVLQPPPGLATVTWGAALPWRIAQRPFVESTRGTGLVALAERAP